MTALPRTWQGIAIPYGASLEALKAAIDGPVPERWAAFRALAATPGTDALHALVEYAISMDPHVRRAAIEGIGSHSEGRLAIPAVCNALDDSDQFVVRTACIAAAALVARDAHDRIHRLLLDPSPDTRCTAVAALEHLWRESDYPAVLLVFRSDTSLDTRKQAAWTLRANVTSTTWRELFGLWCDAELARYRAWSCELAETFGTAAQVPTLEALARDKDGHVRAAAARALRRVTEAG